MRIYEILDSENEMSVGILQYYEKEQKSVKFYFTKMVEKQ